MQVLHITEKWQNVEVVHYNHTNPAAEKIKILLLKVAPSPACHRREVLDEKCARGTAAEGTGPDARAPGSGSTALRRPNAHGAARKPNCWFRIGASTKEPVASKD